MFFKAFFKNMFFQKDHMDLCKKFVNSGLHKINNYYNAAKYLVIVLPELYDACGVKIYYKIVIIK